MANKNEICFLCGKPKSMGNKLLKADWLCSYF